MKLKLPPEFDQAEIAARLFDLLDRGATTMADSVVEVPTSVYTDQELARREREEIFTRIPVIAAHGSELASPFDRLVAQLPNNEVVLVRQADRSVRAFVNACRHRGARLVEEGSSSLRVLSCRYHGWSYDPDGKLRNITHDSTFGDVDRGCLGLVELPSEERHGFVWVVDSPGASIDVAAWLGPEVDDSLSAFRLDTFVCYRRGDFDEPMNWKVLVDGFFDAYHIKTTHAKSVARYFHNNVQIWEELGRHSRTISARKSIDKVRNEPPGAQPIDWAITITHWILPNLSLIRQPDHFELVSMLPDPFDVNRCRAQLRLLVPEAPTTADEIDLWDKNWDILMAVLRNEDIVLNRNLQQAVRSRDVKSLLLGRNEVGNQSFHRWLQRSLDAPSYNTNGGTTCPDA